MKVINLGFLLLIPCLHYAQEIEHSSTLLGKIKIDIEQGLNFLQQTQIKETLSGKQYAGEWNVKMGLRTGFLLLGSNLNADDSNCFSVSTIHNGLARIYLQYPEEYAFIIPTIDRAFEKIISYQSNHAFNFWNLLPPYRTLLKTDVLGNQPLVRRPTTYPLKSRYINQAANITEDADDTSLGYMAIFLRKKINSNLARTEYIHYEDNDTIYRLFDSYRDTLRHNKHWYNFLNGNNYNTGAYLTWLGKEYSFKKWRFHKVLAHNAIFFLPASECYPHPYKPYIPYGTNDLDAVVNANVLACIKSLNQDTLAKGFKSAVQYITLKAKRQKSYFRAGVYYPNTYHFPYAVALAYASGVTQLREAAQYIVPFVTDTQKKDGSWHSRKIVNKRDKIQSTIYAIATLIYCADLNDEALMNKIINGINYLNNHKKIQNNTMHLTGGVFFSGGTVVRNTLFWKSDAYTTLIYIQALTFLRKKIESGQACTKP